MANCPQTLMLSALYHLLVLLYTFFILILSYYRCLLVVCYPLLTGRTAAWCNYPRAHPGADFLLYPAFRRQKDRRRRRSTTEETLRHLVVNTIRSSTFPRSITSLNFRWVSKRAVFKTPFFGQYLCYAAISASTAAAPPLPGLWVVVTATAGCVLWISRRTSVAIFPEKVRVRRNGEILPP